ncbi:MAG: hypothetical protein ILA26_09255 [Methanobrevibacter sp.]|uniref:putative glycoside hydrolase n=1 Tax=Methanobrevibacter sp. TaxID=66852 RepID=UPI001B5F9B7E|nr:putative glycoside hydrolase [Methanobrevibacter sp.]MBP3792198.1 hypothetical protein [Methanobrevibacter sp.]
MNKKIIFGFIIFLSLFLTISYVSANENVTDAVCLDDVSSQDMGIDLNSDSQILKNDSSDDGEIEKNKSAVKFTASDVETYTNLQDTFTVKLKSNGTPLANKSVKVILNGVKYNGITNDNGKYSINFKLKTGTYNVQYFFEGDDDYAESNGTAIIKVNPDLVTYLTVADKNINYRQGSKTIFQLKLVDINNNPVKGKNVKIKVNGVTYTVKTNDYGIASCYLNLKKGTYTVAYSFEGSGLYLHSSGTFKITVKSKLAKGNGYWVDKWGMMKVSLKKLSKKGTKQIFLQHTVFSKYGSTKVIKWIKKAHKYGIKVHIWMAVFYKDGKFVHASNKKGVYNYAFMNEKINLAKYYASFKEVDGIHFDYLRFGGNAYKYKNAVSAVNYFVKEACIKIRGVNPNCIISAAVMPEPTSMKYYYGQDVPTISKYLDVVIPMIYKGNYKASSKWIKKTTKKFVKQSKGSAIWSGLQSYHSDWDISKLSYNSLLKDAKNAKKGGATGVVLFRFGLSALLNFKKL